MSSRAYNTHAFDVLGVHFPERKACIQTFPVADKHLWQHGLWWEQVLFFANGVTCLIPTPLNLQSAILTDSWLKTEPAPQQQQQQQQQQHLEEPRPWRPHPPPPPLPMPPTTTSMSPKSGDLVASAPLLSPFPPPWRWELATFTVPLRHTHVLLLFPKDFSFLSPLFSNLYPSTLSCHTIPRYIAVSIP